MAITELCIDDKLVKRMCPTLNARRCIQAAKDVEDGSVSAKAYTDMDEMMRDLLK